MRRTLCRSLATATAVTGLLLLGNGIAAAQDGPDDNVVVGVTLPVEQHVVNAHPIENGYVIELFPANGNNHAQPLRSSGAQGAAINSPGVVSGNVVQVPVEVPVNVCGNTINVVGLLNPATGNTCINK